jgi:hypothetical protein
MSLASNSHFPDALSADFLANGSDRLMTGSFGPEAELFGVLVIITSVELLLPAATFGTFSGMGVGVTVRMASFSRCLGATASSPLSFAPLGFLLAAVPSFKAGGLLWLLS